MLTLNRPVDSVLPVNGSLAVVLAGRQLSTTRFLGHDELLIVNTRRDRVLHAIPLPPYTTPPGLVGAGSRGMAIVILDDRLLLINALQARIVRQWSLDIQAVGWPAAVTTDGRVIFVVGQPRSSLEVEARLEALRIEHGRSLRVLWRRALGLTHAGVWLGVAGQGNLVTYFPDAYDLHGWIALWNAANGHLRASYAAASPVAAVSPALHRLYLGTADRVRAFELRTGREVAVEAGSTPVAVDEIRHLVMFVRHDGVVIAPGKTLQPLRTLPFAGTRSLSVTMDGGTLLVGLPTGLARVDLGSCRA